MRLKSTPSNACVIALDLGGTKLSSAIVNSSGKLLHRHSGLLGGKSGRAVGRLVTQEILTLLQLAGEKRLSIKAVGVAVAGIAHSETGCVWAPNIAGWTNYRLRPEIETALRSQKAKAKLPMPRVLIEGDRGCYILGECWRGSARGCKNAIYLSIGTGIGAGILVNGELLRGAQDIAGAVGWLALNEPFIPAYRGCGCFEFHASGPGLVKAATRPPSIHRASQPRAAGFSTTSAVFEAFFRGEGVAKKSVEQAIVFWGMAAANLVSIFNPEKIVFGGGVFGPATKLLPKIRREAEKWAQPISMKHVKFEPSRTGPNAGLLGAAFQAFRMIK